jgi:hypothetical protein
VKKAKAAKKVKAAIPMAKKVKAAIPKAKKAQIAGANNRNGRWKHEVHTAWVRTQLPKEKYIPHGKSRELVKNKAENIANLFDDVPEHCNVKKGVCTVAVEDHESQQRVNRWLSQNPFLEISQMSLC